MSKNLCYYESCGEDAIVKGLCLKHFNLWLGNIDGFKKHGRSLEDRFWSFVWKPTKNGCWLWRGSLARGGYGTLIINLEKGNHSKIQSHHFSWKLHYGNIPDGLWVLHRCDVRACVNPKHLYLGDQADNMKDKVRLGNSDYGERNNHVKLTEDKVLKIRYLQKTTNLTQTALAKMFNISCVQIGNIIQYRNWIYPEILRRETNG